MMPPHLATSPYYLGNTSTVAGSYRMPPAQVTSIAAPVYMPPQVVNMSVGVPYSVSHTLAADPLFPTMASAPAPVAHGGGFKFYGPNEGFPLEELAPPAQSEPLLQTTPPQTMVDPSYGVAPQDAYGSYGVADSQPQAPSQAQAQANFQDADRYEAMASMHEQKVEQLAQQPQSVQNLEAQIQELLEGQKALKYELDGVKAQCFTNYGELEYLRREAQHHIQQQQQQQQMQGPPPQYSDYGPPAPMDYQQQGPPGPDRSFTEPERPVHHARPASPGPRNLGYGETSVMDTVNRYGDHAKNLHATAMKSVKSSMGSIRGGGGGGQSKLFGRC